MVLNNTDRVLKGVGVLLVIALVAWAGLALVLPPAPPDVKPKVTKFSSSGAFLGSSCGNMPDTVSSGCTGAATMRCQNDNGRKCAKISGYPGKSDCQNRKNCQDRPCIRT